MTDGFNSVSTRFTLLTHQCCVLLSLLKKYQHKHKYKSQADRIHNSHVSYGGAGLITA